MVKSIILTIYPPAQSCSMLPSLVLREVIVIFMSATPQKQSKATGPLLSVIAASIQISASVNLIYNVGNHFRRDRM